MGYFPFFVDVENQNCLVVGGGVVALRKIEKLLPFNPNITVVSPKVHKEILSIKNINIIKRKFDFNDLKDKNLIVVNISGNAVAMPWVNEVPAIVQGWFLGSEAGTALASVLVGDANPSGKLPFTFPAKLEDVGAHKLGEYPGNKEELAQSKHRGDTINEIYREDIFVGYRWADKEKIKPLFPFGHGLSYTTFAYGKPSADKKTMTVDDTISFTVNVKNTGTREGQEVVQLYISDKKSSLPRPIKELKGFRKVKLAPGEEKTVTLTIDKKALSFFDDAKHEWVAEPGKFEAMIGSSSCMAWRMAK